MPAPIEKRLDILILHNSILTVEGPNFLIVWINPIF